MGVSRDQAVLLNTAMTGAVFFGASVAVLARGWATAEGMLALAKQQLQHLDDKSDYSVRKSDSLQEALISGGYLKRGALSGDSLFKALGVPDR